MEGQTAAKLADTSPAPDAQQQQQQQAAMAPQQLSQLLLLLPRHAAALSAHQQQRTGCTCSQHIASRWGNRTDSSGWMQLCEWCMGSADMQRDFSGQLGAL